ncbi:MAG: 30S ribosomal protein S6 [Deltaproteobacteria bacterium]|nr:30S ribosomal protein S6 [Deltaproteobacteria bacterium]
MREYETTFIVQPEISEEGLLAICERLDGLLDKRSAVRLFYDDMGRRRLAYEIRNFQKGQYLTLFYLDDGKVVPEIERALRLDDAVLRFLTVLADGDVKDIEARKAEAVEIERVRAERAAERAAREAKDAERAAEEAAREAEEAARAAEEAARAAELVEEPDVEDAEGSDAEKAEGSDAEKAEGSDAEKAEGSDAEKAEGSDAEKADEGDSNQAGRTDR